MAEPIFVIHGVANRDPARFTAAVAALEAACGVEMVPVYWGDLGARSQFMSMTVPAWAPSAARTTTTLRDDSQPAPAELTLDLLPGPTPGTEGGAGQWPRVEEEIRHVLADESTDTTVGLRHDENQHPNLQDALALLADEWDTTRWLARTDDPDLLRATAHALAHALGDLRAAEGDEPYGGGLRSMGGSEGGGRWRSALRRRLEDLDRIAGAAVQAVAGRANHALRTRIGPGTTNFLGDVLVYQRHQAAIHARVRATIDRVDPRLGRGPDTAVRVVAHSLGGVIAVDMATAAVPVWTSSLVTFGSQAAFFHVCDPRGGQLADYEGEKHVALPPSLTRWVNLWEPLDMLAFSASRVFCHHDGAQPQDIPLPHSATAGLWTHSAYWDMPAVAAEISKAMAADPHS
ncbi:hypothetical protein [Streptomyces sp. Y7]|uniref:hypothetical protein n=1 Tax=Streptomyces sp. Y7 TaxID=3342392 RepID=UPI0037153AC5